VPVKGGYLIAAGGGAILLWSGIKGHSWSHTLRDVVNGQPVGAADLPITTSPAAYTSGERQQAQAQFLPSGGGTRAKNRAIGRTMAAAYGWATGAEWAALDWLWGTAESNWDNHARNPTSGAYGIPQALPPSKMGALANPPLSSAAAQIRWGLKYIKQVYGDPVRAAAFHRANNYY